MKVTKNHRGNYVWEDYLNGKRIRKESSEWKTQKEVKAAHKEFFDMLSEGTNPDNPTFSFIIDQYLKSYAITRKRSSVRRVESVIDKHIKPFFGNKKIKSITLKDIESFQAELLNITYTHNNETSFYSNDYLEAIQTRLRAILNYARLHSYISVNPLELQPFAYRREFRHKKQFTILTYRQYEQFTEEITDPSHKIIFSLLYWCGLRSGELMALNINDIDLINGEVHIYKNYDTKSRIITSTKTDKDRYVDLPEKCIKDIEDLIKHASINGITGNYPIVGLIAILSKTQMTRIKKQYIDLANERYNIPYFTFHELRHTHVSTLLDLGLNAKDIADRLGHSVEMVNNTYGHLFPKRKKELMNKLNSLQ